MKDIPYDGPECKARHDELRRAWVDGWTRDVDVAENPTSPPPGRSARIRQRWHPDLEAKSCFPRWRLKIWWVLPPVPWGPNRVSLAYATVRFNL